MAGNWTVEQRPDDLSKVAGYDVRHNGHLVAIFVEHADALEYAEMRDGYAALRKKMTAIREIAGQ